MRRCHSKLWLYFTGVVFSTVVVFFLVVSGGWMLFNRLGIIDGGPIERRIPFLGLTLLSLMIGVAIAIFVGKLIILPIQQISEAFNELSKGNFSVRVPEDARLEEIREMSKRFNETAFDLSHIETLRSDFVVNVSHEFKTPIAAIEGYATLLQSQSLPPERRERYVGKILDNSRKLSTLSSDILTLSKLENRQTIPEYTGYRLDEQIRMAILSLESKWSEREISFDIDLEPTDYYGCEQLLERVWSNILDNAIKHSPRGGVISVKLSSEAERLVVSIADQGDGMSEEVKKHIFEKFYQGDKSRNSEGNGLGLALVKRILDLCGGEVSVESEPHKGAEFSVSLRVGNS